MRATSFDQVGERDRARPVFRRPVLSAFLPKSRAVPFPQFLSRNTSAERLAAGLFNICLVLSNVFGASPAPIPTALLARRR